MNYRRKSFSVAAPGTDQYRDNYDRCFGKKEEGRGGLLNPAHADLHTERLVEVPPADIAFGCVYSSSSLPTKNGKSWTVASLVLELARLGRPKWETDADVAEGFDEKMVDRAWDELVRLAQKENDRGR